MQAAQRELWSGPDPLRRGSIFNARDVMHHLSRLSLSAASDDRQKLRSHGVDRQQTVDAPEDGSRLIVFDERSGLLISAS